MKKIIQRLLIFFVGIPLVMFVVFFEPWHHVLLHATITAFSFMASLETYNLLAKSLPMQNKPLVVLLATCIPASVFVCGMLNISLVFSSLFFILCLILLLAIEIFPAPSKTSPFENSNKKIAGSLFVLVYGGYLLSFLSRMTLLDHSTQYIVLFLSMVFFCDSAAWFFGTLFGKGNRGFIQASPNKSLAGFVGGTAASMACGLVCAWIWPQIFPVSWWKMIVLGGVVALSAIFGDLAESVFKRSAKEKDSGTTIPGRGGALDSIDSILIAAPVFYLIINILFGQP